MRTVRHGGRPRHRAHGEPPRLPVRWAVVGIIATAAGVTGYLAGGLLAGMSLMVTVALACHQLID